MYRGTGSDRAWLRAESGGHSLDLQPHFRKNLRRSSSVVQCQERGLVIAFVITITNTLISKYRLTVSWMLC